LCGVRSYASAAFLASLGLARLWDAFRLVVVAAL
jgi:hypothetical protein